LKFLEQLNLRFVLFASIFSISQLFFAKDLTSADLDIGSQADEVENLLGIESIESDSLRTIIIPKTIYVGQCPGVKYGKTEGYFVDYNTPVGPDLEVKLLNYSRGLSPQRPPYVDLDYDRGRASDKIKFKIGTEHNKIYFTVREGLNPIKYYIIDESNRKEKVILKTGIFMLKVDVQKNVYRRDMQYYNGSYFCSVF
tara:strand:+ start:23 stop:613 length:591 start_codon:yes stop_codon:yes gene_type:complete